jgi:KRAB domain-containing zinc finger protein
MKSIHGEGISEENVDLRTCNHCSKVFNTPYQLKVHVTCVHATDLPFSCSQCEKKFPTKAYLDTHNRQAHTSKEVQYKCETCDSLYATKNGLQVHVTTKHVAEEEKQYAVCELCGKKFTRPGELRRHLRTHDPNRVKSFKCIEFGCESAFFNQRMLDVHVRTHASTKEALCAICGAGFATAATLRRHLDIVHKGLEPQFSCQICGKGFKQKQNLIQHLRSKSHGGEGHRSQSQQQRKVKGPNLLEGDEGRFGIGIGSWQHQPAVQ